MDEGDRGKKALWKHEWLETMVDGEEEYPDPSDSSFSCERGLSSQAIEYMQRRQDIVFSRSDQTFVDTTWTDSRMVFHDKKHTFLHQPDWQYIHFVLQSCTLHFI